MRLTDHRPRLRRPEPRPRFDRDLGYEIARHLDEPDGRAVDPTSWRLPEVEIPELEQLAAGEVPELLRTVAQHLLARARKASARSAPASRRGLAPCASVAADLGAASVPHAVVGEVDRGAPSGVPGKATHRRTEVVSS